jgi:hypothetical protein
LRIRPAFIASTILTEANDKDFANHTKAIQDYEALYIFDISEEDTQYMNHHLHDENID